MKIFLHLGYPKTASSYLQKNVFSNHPDINFLGKFYKKPKKSKFIFELENKIFTLNDKDFNKYVLKTKTKIKKILSKNKINLISDEAFLIDYKYNKKFTEEILDRLIKFFDKKTEIYVLVFIRNHKDALISNYNQFSHLLKKQNIYYNDIEFAIDENNKKNIFLNNFNYNLKTKIFKNNKRIKKTKIFFYEDFVENKQQFISNLCKFLNIRYLPSVIKDEKIRSHEELKTNNKYKKLKIFIILVLKNRSFKLKYIYNFFNLLFGKKEYKVLKKNHFDNYEQKIINYYYLDTKKLNKEHNKKLKKYLYLKN